jgi:protein TonB
MFAFIVFPNVETQAIATTERIMEAIEIMPEIIERIEQPQEVVRPIVNIEIIDDDISDDSDDEIIYIDTIEVTTLDPWAVIAPPPTLGQTPRFVVYEDAPVVLRRVNPVYPEALRRARIQGTVVLQVEILVDGSIGAIEVFRSVVPGPGGLDEAAVEAVRQWQFQPAQSGGRPVAVWITQPINFTIGN